MATGRTKPTCEEWSTEEKLNQISLWIKSGLTIEQVAKLIGIGFRTFYDWMDRCPQISQTIKEARVTTIEDIERSAIQLAFLGTTTRRQVVNCRTGEIEWIEEQIPPNPTLQMFFLKTLAGQKYGQNREEENPAMRETQRTLLNALNNRDVKTRETEEDES